MESRASPTPPLAGRRLGTPSAAERRQPGHEPVAGGRDPPLHRTGGAEHPAPADGSRASGERAGGEGLVTGIPFIALLLVQGIAPDITASVDRTRIAVGEQVPLTVAVRVSGGESPR